ncbi:MAG: hypothetical protein H8K07_18460 [Nitrospira sp.]|jgi:outer membrane protein assembly factor BamE (lipoprotein component of BamABCDE complex)|nr:hypothetical protein [Nitrospira sp.]MDI3467386.1 hypothetical protein [Nitrospira sp.]
MRIVIALLVGFLFAGCTTIGSTSLKDIPADWPPVGATKAEIQSRLGPPSTQSVTLQNGVERETWGYH